MSDQWYENRKYLVSEVARLEARVRELEDADLCLSQLRADNLEIRSERDALRDRVRELEATHQETLQLWLKAKECIAELEAAREAMTKGAKP